MPVKDLPIFTYYDKQRFPQFSPQDNANWYLVDAPTGKREHAMYPAMGRQHITYLNNNVLIFSVQPRAIFKSINFMYVIVGSSVYQISENFVQFRLVNSDFTRQSGPINFAYLPVTQAPDSEFTSQYQRVFCMLTDGVHIFVIDETTKEMTTVTDSNAPPNPLYVAAFGNRFVVSSLNSTQFSLTQINLGSVYDPADAFTIDGGAVFAQESGIIRQMAVLFNQLYIFTDFTTGIWANIQSTIGESVFPWKKNTSYDWDYGIVAPLSLDVDFGIMTWLAQNRNGLVAFMSSDGQMPKKISTQAINVLLQQAANDTSVPGFLSATTTGFMYQYEDSIFYRVSAGSTVVDEEGFIIESANSLEYAFDTSSWSRRIEKNGSRNLVQDHVFFSGKHIVTVVGQKALYEIRGDVYVNELLNPEQSDTQADDAFISYPIRYEAVTRLISEKDYSEFITNYVEIDFVWGDQTFIKWNGPSANTRFIVSEDVDSNGDPIYIVAEDGETFIIAEGTNTPILTDETYYNFFKPHIELFISDDGGINFYSADVLEFSQLGVYSWRMRWYQCGPSRNRCYKLVCVSPSPIVVLGGVHEVVRASGGAN